MATEGETQRVLGSLEARVDALELRLDKMETKIDAIHKAVTEASGSVRVLLAVASIGAALGGLIVSVLNYVRGG